MLIPMFLIIGIWGGHGACTPRFKFFLYTFLGSGAHARRAHLPVREIRPLLDRGVQALPLSQFEQRWIFLAFFAAFAVKVPMWPVHTWLPDAHVEAPTGGSVILAAIMLKMGATVSCASVCRSHRTPAASSTGSSLRSRSLPWSTSASLRSCRQT